jgi:hypothetical protein
MQETTLAPVPQEKTAPVEVVTETPNLDTMERADTLVVWSEYRKKIEALKSSVEAVLVADPALASSAKIARANRLELRQIRIAVENKRKELGEGLLRKKQAIDGSAKEIKELIEPYEEKLQAIEDHAENLEAERLRQLAADRTAELSKYTATSNAVNYAALSVEEFETMLADAKTVFELKQAEAKRAEEARIAKEKAEAEEREHVRLENERLKKEAEEREAAIAAERAKVEAEKKAAEEKARKEREAIEAKARAEREAAEAKARAEREEAEKKEAAERARLREIAEKERQEREALEAKIAAEKKAEADRIAAEEKARQEAALAPDREKLAAFAAAVRALPVPSITSKRGQTVIAEKIEEFAAWVEAASKNLRAK